MDTNKQKLLQEIDYKINPCCSLCQYGNFKSNNEFGTCGLYEYEHLKHTGPARKLSIVRIGHCQNFEKDETKVVLLGKFDEFLK